MNVKLFCTDLSNNMMDETLSEEGEDMAEQNSRVEYDKGKEAEFWTIAVNSLFQLPRLVKTIEDSF